MFGVVGSKFSDGVNGCDGEWFIWSNVELIGCVSYFKYYCF